jgi:hypothetical protein
MRVNFGRISKKMLPVTYRTATLVSDDEGKSLNNNFFDSHIFWHLTMDIMMFIKDELE